MYNKEKWYVPIVNIIVEHLLHFYVVIHFVVSVYYVMFLTTFVTVSNRFDVRNVVDHINIYTMTIVLV